jgi:hypothetical protein
VPPSNAPNLAAFPTFRVDTLIGIALRPLSLDIPDVFEGFQITIEVPFEFAQRDQLLGFMESKFPGAEFSIIHREVSTPTVAEVLVQHNSAVEAEKTGSPPSGEDSEAVLLKATDALTAFTKSGE